MSIGLSPEIICKWAQLEGISVIGAGDFTHPLWLGELRKKLQPAGNGLHRLKKIVFHSALRCIKIGGFVDIRHDPI
jgi:PHP family Zn ribbon phosphoesterase